MNGTENWEIEFPRRPVHARMVLIGDSETIISCIKNDLMACSVGFKCYVHDCNDVAMGFEDVSFTWVRHESNSAALISPPPWLESKIFADVRTSKSFDPG